MSTLLLAKVACGAFADIGFASGGQRRDFARLPEIAVRCVTKLRCV